MSGQAWLFVVWFTGFVLCIGMVLMFWPAGYILPEQVMSDVSKITAIYVPYLAPIVAFWYVKQHSKSVPRASFVVAIVCSATYNLLISVIVASVYFRPAAEGLVENTLELGQGIATLMAFLVGPAIGFYFGKTK